LERDYNAFKIDATYFSQVRQTTKWLDFYLSPIQFLMYSPTHDFLSVFEHYHF
jgi:hypothetical protein